MRERCRIVFVTEYTHADRHTRSIANRQSKSTNAVCCGEGDDFFVLIFDDDIGHGYARAA